MKTDEQNQTVKEVKETFINKCAAGCRKLLKLIQQNRDAIRTEFHETAEANRQLVHLALNEAEALAWDSGFPLLFFHDLATEKVQSVANWQTHQESVRHGRNDFAQHAFAA